MFFFFFKQKTAYEMRISDWSSDVCSSDLLRFHAAGQPLPQSRVSRQHVAHRPIDQAGDAVAARRVEPARLIDEIEESRRGESRVARERIADQGRSEERRVGNECVSTCSSRGSPHHKKNKKARNNLH